MDVNLFLDEARALEEFKRQGIDYDSAGRSSIDEILLKGFWTPIGFVDNARVNF